MTIFNRKDITRIAISILLLVTLAFTGTGCGLLFNPAVLQEPEKDYSIADLAEIAGKSIAYIEAADSDYADYYWFGSGFVASSDGIIVTNYHVLDGAVTILIEVDGQVYNDVTVLAVNEDWDLAILKIEAANLKPLKLAHSIDNARLGEQVVAMGNPEGFKRTVSDGIISTVYRRLEGFTFDHIQTTAPISKGSSGGPLLNMRGEVIGVNTLTYLTGQNLNFAVPIDLVHNLLANPGQSLTVAEVFGHGFSTASGTYEPKPGEFAVTLTWEGDADLDLEIWTEDFEFLGTAAMLGGGPDISQGSQGEEWFVFGEVESPGDGAVIDYSSGRYVIAVYYWGPEPEENLGIANAQLTVNFPDGSREIALTEELWYSPPYDHWFAILVDADLGDYKILDFFFDAPLIAMLEWDSGVDLDLVIWDHKRETFFTPSDFWYGYDFRDGRHGLEIFRFGAFDIGEETIDLTAGIVDVLVYMQNTGNPVTEATITLLSETLDMARYSYTLTPDPGGDYLWMAAYDLDLHTLEYFEPTEAEARLFLD